MVATFLTTYLMAVLQPSGYSIFHGKDTPIQLSLSWQSYPCQCLNTETSAWGNRGFTTETLSISRKILSMKCEDEKWKLVAYISKLLNEAERNYEIHDKKMLAIIRCLEV